jgi:predicted ATP-grasp superfamily ATP-dependent carboligase
LSEALGVSGRRCGCSPDLGREKVVRKAERRIDRPTVIVTDGEQRAALAVVRSLGAAGYRCVVTSSSRGSIAGGSRFTARTVIVPDALEHPTELADAIVRLVAVEHAEVVLPITEPSLLAILPVRTRLAPAVVPFPELAEFSALTDKERLLEEASRLGIAVPTQRVLRNIADLRSLDLAELPYPIVVKPARSVNERNGVRSRFAVTYASDAAQLMRLVDALPPAAFPLLLQQRVMGPGIGIFLLVWDGEVEARFAHQRLTEKPASGGVSVYRESVSMDESLLARSRALLDRFGWRGVAMVEYKCDAATGQPYLMEVNGRFWGSLQLAIDAGVDFPRILVACALGEVRHETPPYRVGVRSRWWWGQIDHLIGRARHRATSVPLAPATRAMGDAMRDVFLGPFRRDDYEEVLRWTDPAPFLNETVRWLGRR